MEKRQYGGYPGQFLPQMGYPQMGYPHMGGYHGYPMSGFPQQMGGFPHYPQTAGGYQQYPHMGGYHGYPQMMGGFPQGYQPQMMPQNVGQRSKNKK
ncbi:hypothetical protein [Neobacillus kokaensis]|uniref:Spore coat protein n=1 Tax=Neobacillus kokaensis TaxID=2759023 RepID=A0ABQ3N0S3_9BACI|nr:hypothetical protein [Neobacillus kokaensis]GHH97669.1 hypothetical protein AM1BK_12120 [Neobacillus kokaensis]